jgi:SAM-dependent methyltransferase
VRQAAYRQHYAVEDHHWWFRGRRAVVESLLSRTALPQAPRILDAGCGTGGNLKRYAQRGPTSGVDPSPEAVSFCRQRGFDSVQQAGLEELPFPDESFDLIAATDVLEHVEEDAVALREMLRVAAPGAALLLTVPAYAWLWSEEDENLHHYRRYTRPMLKQRAQESGWAPQIATYFNTILLPPIALARRLSRLAGRKGAEVDATPPALDRPLSLPMRLEARLIAAGAALPAGVSVGIVCRKP